MLSTLAFLLAQYGGGGASGGGSSAGYWIVVGIIAAVVIGLVVWGISRLRHRRGADRTTRPGGAEA